MALSQESPLEAEPIDAVVELLGMLAFGELLAFERMANDARLAPDLRRRAMLSEMAAVEVTSYQRVSARLTELGINPAEAMRAYVPALQEYHDSTEPKDWPEALIKVYVGDGIADDFCTEIAAFLAPEDGELVREVLHDSRYAEFALEELRASIAADPKLANRLSMWARRLVGESLSHAQQVSASRASLAALIIKGTGDEAAVERLFDRLTTAHTDRMAALGLNN